MAKKKCIGIKIIKDPSKHNIYIKKLNGIRVKERDLPNYLTSDVSTAKRIRWVISLGEWMMVSAFLLAIVIAVIVIMSLPMGNELNIGVIAASWFINTVTVLYYLFVGLKLANMNVSPSIVCGVCWVNILLFILSRIFSENSSTGIISLVVLILSIKCLYGLPIFQRWFDGADNKASMI